MENAEVLQILRMIVILVPGFLIAVTVHEFAHGLIAYRFGDSTAKDAGRLTLNPISHLDLFGSLVLILTQMIGWAKPVPVNPQRLRNPRKDMMWISTAGPVANFIAALVLAGIFHITVIMIAAFGEVGELPNIVRGSVAMLIFAVQINIGLGIFNLLPVPPLDGSKILMGVLPAKAAAQFSRIEPYGIFLLLLLIVTDAFDYVLFPPIRFLIDLLLGRFS
jgi:Zn-dependent protease